MEAGNRCKDECLPEETNRRIVDIISDVNLAYSEHARKYLHECGLPKERVYVTGSPMAEVLHQNLPEIEKSDILERLRLKPQGISCCQPIGRRTLIQKRIFCHCFLRSTVWRKNMICRRFIPASQIQTSGGLGISSG